MTAVIDELETGTDSRQVHQVTERTKAGRFVRSVWRVHFYAALFATPVLICLALSGLVIMYTDPIEGALYGDKTRVSAAGREALPLSAQREAADTAAGEAAALFRVVTPSGPDRVTRFFYSQASGVPYYLVEDATYVNVDPYTARVVAKGVDGDGVIGLANRIHGFLNTDRITVPLPSIAHRIDSESNPDTITRVALGDFIIEISMGWALVLILSGLYLWWPRKSQKGKRLLAVRIGKKGRLRWRDLHASTGILAIGVMLLFITTGMPWSTYWGEAWSAASNKLTPGSFASTNSTPVKSGDLNRFGQRISWATNENPVPASAPPEHQHQGGLHGGDAPAATTTPAGVAAQFSLTDVDRAAREEGMKDGYSIVLPVDDKAADGTTTYGSYQLSNIWPGAWRMRRISTSTSSPASASP